LLPEAPLWSVLISPIVIVIVLVLGWRILQAGGSDR
jgi:hypothetical protein